MLTILLASVIAFQKPIELTDASYLKIREQILPKEDELQWTKIQWRMSLWPAVVDGQRLDKPVLLWAMNGHPMACT